MAEMGIVEPPCLGKKYSWYQPNGVAVSRIDKILMARELMDYWKIKAQWIGKRDVSDHCPVWLIFSNKNWGPKPFKFINGWLDHSEGKNFIEAKWKELKVDGWTAHVIKEKLKYVKECLKKWNKEVYGKVDLNIEKIVEEINLVEEEGSSESEWNEEKWKRLNKEFWGELHRKESLLAQKSRERWIQKGDGNTKFFHNSVKLRQRRNQIEMIKVGDGWLSGVEEIKEEARRHFGDQFKEDQFVRPTLEGIQFKHLTVDEVDTMTEAFTMEEIKQAVWSCDGDKSPGPDGFNFTFIKSCWDTIKGEVLEAMVQFHSNGKLPRAFTSGQSR